MKKRGLLGAGIALLVLYLGACSRGPTSYIPLVPGMTWKYQVIMHAPDGREVFAVLTVANLAAKEIRGKMVTPQEHEIQIDGQSQSHSHWIYIGADPEGVYLYGDQGSNDRNPHVATGPVPFYILKEPFQGGKSWDAPGDLDGRQLSSGKATIAGTNELVVVPAGTFKGCLKVHIAAATGDKDMWFAPSVGMVMSFLKGGYRTEVQLVSFKP